MWQPVTLDMAVKFYASVSEAFPDFPIMVYANARAFRFAFDLEFWKRIVESAPTVMSAKFSSKAILREAVALTKQRVNFVPPIRSRLRVRAIGPRNGKHMLDFVSRTATGPCAHESARGGGYATS